MSSMSSPSLQERLAHYVSLIPFLPDAITFSGACDIWTTSDVRVQSQVLHLPPSCHASQSLSHPLFFLPFPLCLSPSLPHELISPFLPCSSNSCTCSEGMRRSTQCCYATTSSTVGGGPGWCLDTPFLKVHNFSQHLIHSDQYRDSIQ